MPFDLDITESAIYRMGQAQNARQMLSQLVEGRFGPLSRTIRKRIAEADQSQLEKWFSQCVSAENLADVFRTE